MTNATQTEPVTGAGAEAGAESTTPLRIAYVVNIYPAPSSTFIRRELIEIEAGGATVSRLALRRWPGELTDPMDQDENQKTRAVLEVGALGLLWALAATAVTRPGRFLRALRTAIRLGRRGNGVAKHLIYLAEACVLLGWHRELETDHVHAHFGTNSATVALLCRLLGGPPYSFTVHGPEEFDQPIGLSLGEKVAGSAFAVTISQHGGSQLRRWASYDHWPKIQVVHCGLDSMFLEAPPVAVPDARRLVCVGRLAEQKGLPILIEAAGRLHAEGVEFDLTLVGDGSLRGELESLIAQLDLNGRVHLVGWRSNAEVRDLLLNSRALVLPSFAEGLPVAIMESLALGRPVVTTWIAGTPELVLPGVNGWLVAPGSVDDLSQAMREVLEADPADLDRMGRAGADRVAQRHNIVTEAGKLANLIAESQASRPS